MRAPLHAGAAFRTGWCAPTRPERIQGEWWRRDAERMSVRDYFRVEDETGRRYWLFRSGDGERAATGDLSWYLHGVFG